MVSLLSSRVFHSSSLNPVKSSISPSQLDPALATNLFYTFLSIMATVFKNVVHISYAYFPHFSSLCSRYFASRRFVAVAISLHFSGYRLCSTQLLVFINLVCPIQSLPHKSRQPKSPLQQSRVPSMTGGCSSPTYL